LEGNASVAGGVCELPQNRRKAHEMIVNLLRRAGDTMVLERLEGGVTFEGGEAQEGVLATFKLDGRDVTGRIINISEFSPSDDGDGEPLIAIEEIDREAHDAASERVLAELPPRNDFNTNI
jgi:hypothetical protein